MRLKESVDRRLRLAAPGEHHMAAAWRTGSGRFIGTPLYPIANSTTVLVLAPRWRGSRSILLLDVYLLGYCQGVMVLDAEIPNGAFNLRVSKQ